MNPTIDESQFLRLETETLDAAQIEQEIEKEALEVTSTAAEGEEEDTTLADIEGIEIEFFDFSSSKISPSQMEQKKTSERIISN